jgi:hypothetical protein
MIEGDLPKRATKRAIKWATMNKLVLLLFAYLKHLQTGIIADNATNRT